MVLDGVSTAKAVPSSYSLPVMLSLSTSTNTAKGALSGDVDGHEGAEDMVRTAVKTGGRQPHRGILHQLTGTLSCTIQHSNQHLRSILVIFREVGADEGIRLA